MSWVAEKRAFWSERVEEGVYRTADCRILFGPLNWYWWHWRNHRLGAGVRYSLWRQLRRWDWGRWGLRGPMLIRNGHPWGLRLCWRWRGWSNTRPPWAYNVWTTEPTELPETDVHDGIPH